MEYQPGQRVRVTYDSDVRSPKEAIVRRVPPFTEHVGGERVEYTDVVEVEYPNSRLDDSGLFGNIRENVPVENIEVV